MLISGETGTGKELAARAFHQAGPRRAKPFVTVNCSAVVDTLFESELFGHVRGAFTGAVEAKPGVFEAAHGGTLFLDEVGELPLAMQAKLLRALENGEVQRVGSLQPQQVDVAVIAATNRDLRAEVAAGRFRGDLFYRLNVVEVTLPPLRDRREDIPYLTAAFMRECAQRLQQAGARPDAARRAAAAARALGRQRPRAAATSSSAPASWSTARCCRSASWPGRSASSRCGSGTRRAPASRGAAAPRQHDAGAARALEREHIVDVLRQVNGNRMAAAKVLGISRRALYRRLERHQLADEAPRPPFSRRPA